jgi:zinc/manganese transport system permease protein
MHDFFFLMWKPLLACLILTGIHAYLGIHVIERKVIFVDLALAQVAALGATVAFLFGFDLHGPATYWFSLAATFLGAVIFSITRTRHEKIPQEAIIGIVYAFCAAAAVLILSRSAEGDEHIRYILVGDILLVNLAQIIKMAFLYALIGVMHWTFRRIFIMISSHPAEAFRKRIPVKKWDLVFYLTFGLVVTSSVQIAGVLLVFCFLIVPAVGAILLSGKLSHRLMIGWVFGTVASILGIVLSYFLDLPTGATVVCIFGGLLVFLTAVRSLIASIF